MKVLSIAGIVFLVIAVVQSGIVSRNVDPDGFDDEADSQEVHFDEGTWFEDDDHHLVEISDEADDETVEETELVISERVFFHLYTKKNPKKSQQLVIGDVAGLKKTNWKANKLTRIVIHGWINTHESDACTLVRDAYLKNGDHNVIVVDWSKIAYRSYGFSARRVRIVGNYIAQMIDFLESQGLDISKLVVVGHSLGGHIAGISALRAKKTVGYVVALDPAGPYFWVSSPGNRVDKNDAANVQVIHTNGGKLGLSKAIGHIDFYPNGGSGQEGCGVDLAGTCAHSRAYVYFAESINSKVGFYGQLCNTWRRFRYSRCESTTSTIMGGNVPTKVPESGSYFMRTSGGSNFALGKL